jgi:hypothetical protein
MPLFFTCSAVSLNDGMKSWQNANVHLLYAFAAMTSAWHSYFLSLLGKTGKKPRKTGAFFLRVMDFRVQ